MSKDCDLERVKLLHSIDAFFAGFLLITGILLALVSDPSTFLAALTNFDLHLSYNNRTFGFPVGMALFLVAIWRSRKIYRARVITRLMQFGLGFFACILVLLKIFLFIVALDRVMGKLW